MARDGTDSATHSPSSGVVAADLESWFEANGRRLPWRAVRDPWAVLVSEIMLQQTQVARVIPRWEEFLRRFPTATSCGKGPVSAVIELWHGLGYNRRAVNLHKAARMVSSEYGGRFPSTVSELLALPGVGAYTARAVAVFAFERSEAVLDTNVARILARTEGRSLTRRQAQDLADRAVSGKDPWVWNQAMLDVGAGHCRPRNPSCEDCPLASHCAWFRAGRPEPDPSRNSAGVSRPQSRFDGSDRQGRGRLVDALRRGPVAGHDIARVAGWADDPDRAMAVARSLVIDGLAVEEGGMLRLP